MMYSCYLVVDYLCYMLNIYASANLRQFSLLKVQYLHSLFAHISTLLLLLC